MVEKHPNIPNKANPELACFFIANNQKVLVTTRLPLSVVHPPEQAASNPYGSLEQELTEVQRFCHDKSELDGSFDATPLDKGH